jgi:hypothetical protein
MKTGLESLDTGASKITYSGNEGPKAPQQMAMADPMLVEQYQQYVFEMEEQGLQPMSFEEFVAQARAGMNEGGIMDSKYNIENRRQYFSGAYGQGAGDRGGDPRGSREENVAAGRTDAGNIQRAEEYRRQQSQTTSPPPTTPKITETIKEKIVSPTQKFIYGVAGNDPTFEKKHINYLLKQGVNVPPNILDILNIDDDESIPFDLYQEYLDYKPTFTNQNVPPGERILDRDAFPMDAANYALVEGKKPGLIMGGDLGNFYKMEKPEGAINPDTKLPFTNAEWDSFKRGVMEDRGLTGPGEGQARELNRLYSGQIGVGGGGGTTVPPVVPPVETENPFVPGSNLPFANYYVGMNPNAAQLAYGQQMGVDPRMYGLTAYADGGRIGYAGGGITGLRQGYFLGKLVKKIGKGIKKVIKSPIGKAALLASPFLMKKGLLSSIIGQKAMTQAPFAKGTGLMGMFGRALGFAKENPFTTIAGFSSLPLIFGESQEDEEGVNYADLSNIFDKYSPDQLRQMALTGGVDRSQYPFLPETAYVADGGRIGYDMGGIANTRAAALNQLYGINDDEDKKLLSQGGSAGLPPITAGIEGQASQSFSDDETPAPTQPDQMPMPRPMMAGRMNPMMRGMNPMMRGMNPMMARGMIPRMMAQKGGLMASVDDPFYRSGDEDEHSFRMFGKPYKELNADELEEFNEEMMRLMNKFSSAPDPMDALNDMSINIFKKPLNELTEEEYEMLMEINADLVDKPMARPDRVMAQEGGLMDLGGMEKDYRNEGGFVPIGGQERADDVPARLSKNEFVFTADAVRAAGGGDIDKGAEIMENMMENLEKGGKVSEESQGLKGARDMFATAQRLEGVL